MNNRLRAMNNRLRAMNHPPAQTSSENKAARLLKGSRAARVDQNPRDSKSHPAAWQVLPRRAARSAARRAAGARARARATARARGAGTGFERNHALEVIL